MGERARFVRRSTVSLDVGEISPDFTGLHVEMKRPTIGEFAEWRELINVEPADLAADRELAEAILTYLAERLVGWNLSIETVVNGQTVEQPLPATGDALATMDPALIQAIGASYTATVARVSPPLRQPSNDGESSVEGRIPMEILSGSPMS